MADHPAFLDISAMAARVCQGTPAADFTSGSHKAELHGPEVDVGILHIQGQGTHSESAGDLFLLVLQGALQVEAAGQSATLNVGEACMITRGTTLNWSASQATGVAFMRHIHSQTVAASLTLVDLNAQMAPSGAPLADLLIGPTPQCRNHTDIKSADGIFSVGTWDSTPYHRKPMHFVHYEMMYVLDGAVTITDAHGVGQTFSKGQVVLAEKGADLAWESTVFVKKIFAYWKIPA